MINNCKLFELTSVEMSNSILAASTLVHSIMSMQHFARINVFSFGRVQWIRQKISSRRCISQVHVCLVPEWGVLVCYLSACLHVHVRLRTVASLSLEVFKGCAFWVRALSATARCLCKQVWCMRHAWTCACVLDGSSDDVMQSRLQSPTCTGIRLLYTCVHVYTPDLVFGF